MVQATHSLQLDVERGPDWLFVRPHVATLCEHATELANEVWQLLEQSLTHRLVLELDDIGPLYSSLVGQLIWLQKRISQEGGLMRLCGLSPDNQRVLNTARLSSYFGNYSDRNDAVMCSRPLQPR
jgi:anti-anti-sigma factor